jgi:hypothetical protein
MILMMVDDRLGLGIVSCVFGCTKWRDPIRASSAGTCAHGGDDGFITQHRYGRGRHGGTKADSSAH